MRKAIFVLPNMVDEGLKAKGGNLRFLPFGLGIFWPATKLFPEEDSKPGDLT